MLKLRSKTLTENIRKGNLLFLPVHPKTKYKEKCTKNIILQQTHRLCLCACLKLTIHIIFFFFLSRTTSFAFACLFVVFYFLLRLFYLHLCVYTRLTLEPLLPPLVLPPHFFIHFFYLYIFFWLVQKWCLPLAHSQTVF